MTDLQKLNLKTEVLMNIEEYLLDMIEHYGEDIAYFEEKNVDDDYYDKKIEQTEMKMEIAREIRSKLEKLI